MASPEYIHARICIRKRNSAQFSVYFLTAHVRKTQSVDDGSIVDHAISKEVRVNSKRDFFDERSDRPGNRKPPAVARRGSFFEDVRGRFFGRSGDRAEDQDPQSDPQSDGGIKPTRVQSFSPGMLSSMAAGLQSEPLSRFRRPQPAAAAAGPSGTAAGGRASALYPGYGAGDGPMGLSPPSNNIVIPVGTDIARRGSVNVFNLQKQLVDDLTMGIDDDVQNMPRMMNMPNQQMPTHSPGVGRSSVESLKNTLLSLPHQQQNKNLHASPSGSGRSRGGSSKEKPISKSSGEQRRVSAGRKESTADPDGTMSLSNSASFLSQLPSFFSSGGKSGFKTSCA